jgi:hypothetical protein
LYRNFKRGKTLTTQVVRKSHLKKRRKASSRVPRIKNYQGAGKNIRGRRRYNHEYTTKILIKENRSPSSPLFLFFYTISHSFMLESLNWAQG